MSRRVFTYRGYTLEELQQMSRDELMKLLPSRKRRSLRRMNTYEHLKLYQKIMAYLRGEWPKNKPLRTHCRDFVILPEMVGVTIHVFNGKEYIPVEITPEKIGFFLGEFAPTCKIVRHGDPGMKATRSSRYVPLK